MHIRIGAMSSILQILTAIQKIYSSLQYGQQALPCGSYDCFPRLEWCAKYPHSLLSSFIDI